MAKYRMIHGGVKMGTGDTAHVAQAGELVELTEAQAKDVGLEHLATEAEFDKMIEVHDAQLALEEEHQKAVEEAKKLGLKARAGGLPENFAVIRKFVEAEKKAGGTPPVKKFVEAEKKAGGTPPVK
jgi:hypothetical protein